MSAVTTKPRKKAGAPAARPAPLDTPAAVAAWILDQLKAAQAHAEGGIQACGETGDVGGRLLWMAGEKFDELIETLAVDLVTLSIASDALAPLYDLQALLEGTMAIHGDDGRGLLAGAALKPLDGVSEMLDRVQFWPETEERSAPSNSGSAAAGEEATERSATNSAECSDAYGHYQHALAVLELVCHEMQASGVVFAARNLMRHDKERLLAAFDEDADALNDASADLWVVLELLAAAAPTLSGEEESCVWGAHALATLSKNALDEHIREVESSGAAS